MKSIVCSSSISRFLANSFEIESSQRLWRLLRKIIKNVHYTARGRFQAWERYHWNQSIVSRWKIEIRVSEPTEVVQRSHPTENHRSSKHSTRRLSSFRRYLQPAICLANIFNVWHSLLVRYLYHSREEIDSLEELWIKIDSKINVGCDKNMRHFEIKF